jgi:hypothetical protein
VSCHACSFHVLLNVNDKCFQLRGRDKKLGLSQQMAMCKHSCLTVIQDYLFVHKSVMINNYIRSGFEIRIFPAIHCGYKDFLT